jgi:SAM-dependent methyltransferase
MGCGTGLVARAIAHRSDFRGKITGIDLSPRLVEAARRLANQERISACLDFRVGDARTLPFVDGTFDAIVAHTLLSHVDDPVAVITEAQRVVKQGGMIGIFDGDYASLTFDHADPVKGEAYEDALIDTLVTNPRVMRQMPRILRAAGLDLVTSFSYVLSEVGAAEFWLSAIEAYRVLMSKSGVLPPQEANAWAAALRNDAETHVFFGSCNFYAYVARSP